MREQIATLIQRKGGVAVSGDLKLNYRHEDTLNPCILDIFQESNQRSYKDRTRTIPSNYEELALNVPRIVDDLIHPPTSIIVASGREGLSIMWRTEGPALMPYEERFAEFRGRVQAHLPEGADLSLADEELHRFFAEHYTANRAAAALVDWLQALGAAAAKGNES